MNVEEDARVGVVDLGQGAGQTDVRCNRNDVGGRGGFSVETEDSIAEIGLAIDWDWPGWTAQNAAFDTLSLHGIVESLEEEKGDEDRNGCDEE